MKITYGKNIYIVSKEQGMKEINIKEAFNIIKSKELKKHADYLRNELDKDKRNAYKSKNLPWVTFNGTFEPRKIEGLIKPSGLMILDYDENYNNEEVENIKKKLIRDKYVYCIFKSPSGALKFIVKIPETHNQEMFNSYYEGVRLYFNKLGIDLDISGKDICRVCFLSHDPKLFLNEKCLVFDKFIDIKKIKTEQINKNKIKDIDRSQEEYKVICGLIGKGKTKEEIYTYMQSFEKWNNSNEQYKTHTYDKAFNFINEQKTLKEEKKREQQIKEEEEIKTPIISASDLLNKDIPLTEWVIQDFLVKNGITIIGGDSGSGKSLLSLNISLHSISNKKLFDLYDCKKSKVLYIDEENTENTIKTRLKDLIVTRNIKEGLDQLKFSVLENIKLDTGQGKNKLGKKKFMNLIETHKPDIVIIDSLVRFFVGDENSSNDVKEIFDTLKLCIKEYGTSFILLHHTTKGFNGGSRKHTLRGSGDLSAFADVVFILNKVSKTNFVGIHQEKNRHKEPIKSFNMMIHEIDNNLNVCYGGDYQLEKTTKIDDVTNLIINTIKHNDWLMIETKVLKPMIVSKGYTGYLYHEALKHMKNQGWIKEGKKKGQYDVNDKFKEVCDYE